MKALGGVFRVTSGLHEAYGGPKKLVVQPGATHITTVVFYPGDYEDWVLEHFAE